MKIKEKAMKELKAMTPLEIITIYEIMLSLKIKTKKKLPNHSKAYIKVREALSKCDGSLSNDILMEREDKI
ncbi:MAG: hypothetical protein AB1422_11255 [bacterium]